MNTYICIGVSACCVIGVSVYCEAVVRRVRMQAEAELRELRSQLEEMVRQAVREERTYWAREVLRREAVANALERKAGEILSVMPGGFHLPRGACSNQRPAGDPGLPSGLKSIPRGYRDSHMGGRGHLPWFRCSGRWPRDETKDAQRDSAQQQ